MKTLLYVLMPVSTNPVDLQDEFFALLNPYRLNSSRDEFQPNSKFDYLCSFEPTLNCSETENELPYELRSTYDGTISKVFRLRAETNCSAMVTPDGIWHDIFDFGWRMMADQESNELATCKWRDHVKELMNKNPDCWVIETWAHS